MLINYDYVIFILLCKIFMLINYDYVISYYGQVNSLRLKSSVASKWATKHLWGYHLFCC